MKLLLRAFVLCTVLAGTAGAQHAAPSAAQRKSSGAQADIRALLEAQVAAWNRSDIEGFMAGYWKSEKTTFVSSSGITRGWKALLDRYKDGYPDKKVMGMLAFTDLEITLLGRDAALIIGRWQLEREKDGKPDRPGGIFSLVARKLPEG